LTVKPDNTVVASAGTSTTLHCKSGVDGSPAWIRNPTTSVDLIVNFNCQPNPAFPEYTVNSSSAGQCDLVINNASLKLAATYRCADYSTDTADAQLTVIGESCMLINVGCSTKVEGFTFCCCPFLPDTIFN